MRIGAFSLYNEFLVNQQNSMKYLRETNTQISSGLKIQYGYQDINTFVNTMRLDQEEVTLSQSVQASRGALQFSQNSDKALNDMTNTLTTFKTKLINAASETNSETTRRALAQELTDLKNYMMNVSNTSINGQYLFSGSSFSVKPIAEDGSYKGNDQKVKALVDSHVQYAYNVDGQSFFLGDDSDYHRSISTNVPMKNKTLQNTLPPEDRYVKESDSVKDMLGNNGDGKFAYFYASGRYSDGTAFKHEIQVDVDAPISDLLSKIKNDFSGSVDVTLNTHGEIEIKDLRTGSSNMQFFLVAHDNTVPATQVTAGLTAGSSSITVNDATSLSTGDLLNIETIGQVKIASISGNTITLAKPLSVSKDQLAGDIGVRKVLADSSVATATVASGATTISLSDVSNIADGDWIKVGDAGMYQVAVGGVSTTTSPAGTVTLTNALTASLTQNDIVTKYYKNYNNSSATAAAAIGATTLDLSNVSGVAVGDEIKVGGNSYTISAVPGTNGALSIDISAALTTAVSSGDTVMLSSNSVANPYSANNTVTATATNTVTITNVAGYSVGDKISIGNGGGSYTVMGVDSATNTLTLDKTASGSGIVVNEDIAKKLATNGSRITEFIKSGSGPRYLGDITGTNDYSDHRMFNFGIELRRKNDNSLAKSSDLLTNVFDSTPDSASFGITLTDGSTTPPSTTQTTFSLGVTSTVGDYVRQVQNALDAKFGQDKFQAGLDDQGRVSIKDLSITEDQKFFAASKLVGVKLLAPKNTFAAANGMETDREYFSKTGGKATGNMSQILKVGNTYASPSDKLVDVAGAGTLAGKTMMFDITDLGGTKRTVPLTLDSTASYFTYNGSKYYVMDATNPQGVTSADKMTYRQLMDTISMVVSGSLPASTTTTAASAAGTNTIDVTSIGNLQAGDQIAIGENEQTYTISSISGTTITLSTNLATAVSTSDMVVSSRAYNSALTASQNAASVSFDSKSRIVIEDKLASTSNTNLNFAMYDADVNSPYGHNRTISSASDNTMSFNSNKLLTLDDPKVDFFTQLQDAIDAVKSGKLRGDFTKGDPRNTGIQNAITSIEHVLEHTIRVHTNAGAISSAFQSSEDRATTLKLNVQTVRSDFLDTDIGEAAANLNQRMITYQAMLSTIGKINGLSLVNYIK